MNTLRIIANTLRASAMQQGMTQSELKMLAGISQRTLTKVLSGQEDFKLSTLLALADRLGLELLLVPKEAAPVIAAGQTTEPRVKSRVAAALDRVRDRAQHASPVVRPRIRSGRRSDER